MLFDFVALTQGCENLLVVNYWNATIGVLVPASAGHGPPIVRLD